MHAYTVKNLRVLELCYWILIPLFIPFSIILFHFFFFLFAFFPKLIINSCVLPPIIS